MKRIAILLIRAYQLLVAPLLGNVCRFEPSCSRYAMAVIEHYGIFRGSLLALRRIGRCHPWNPGGYDPPPAGDEHPRSARTPLLHSATEAAEGAE